MQVFQRQRERGKGTCFCQGLEIVILGSEAVTMFPMLEAVIGSAFNGVWQSGVYE